MSINPTNKHNQVENVSTRVKNTKKEIEQLKTELEKLISLGTQPPEPPIKKLPSFETQPVREPEKNSKKPAPETAKKSPLKKARSYDVNEARNYIKKQREKRAEQLRAQINVTDNKVDLKKQKLKELHQKTIELVTKNVQLKRERSKSREKTPPVRIDRARAKPQRNERVSRPKTRTEAPKTESEQNARVSRSESQQNEKVSRSEAPKTVSEKPQKVAEHSIMTDACVKDTKETQTSRDKGAQWMEPPVVPYPYNFINTVKRKLQFAVNSPRNYIDVGVQNSGTPECGQTKSREEIKEMLIKSANSELRSFASHKCLDLKAVENLELRQVSKNLFIDSESDTSKNIPDISSESVTSVDKPKLDFDKLKNYKLQNESYSSDFHKESVSEIINTESFKKNRDSQSRKVMKTLSDSDSIQESLTLKEPNVSLSIRNLNSINGKTNTITIKSLSENYSSDSSFSQEKPSFKSLLTGSENSKNQSETLSKNTDENSDLEKPQNDVKNHLKNITLRPSSSSVNNVNEIHLKFEAEVRLLNDFNESFRQFMAVEKAFESIKTKNETNTAVRKILQNVDTQTSFIAKTSTEKSPRSSVNTINFSRGSEIIEELNDSIMNASKSMQNSSFSTATEWNLSNLNESSVSIAEEEQSKFSISNIENYNANNCASLLSLNIFDQLIKDEDTRIQQLKAIIKIREQALLDRTKGELVWLEIQKKQLIETGKIEEASLLKKKQRGILLKHEQERNEIKKLKQMQKEASEKRKNTLKRQRNLIKTRLSTDDMLAQITVKKRKERRSMGPLRVVQSRSESVHSETSISVKSTDVVSVTSKSLRVSEESDVEVPVANAKRTLLMREAALQKRRKAAEELLRWHRKLLDEEKKIAELEAAATSVIKLPQTTPDKHKKQLNQLWRNDHYVCKSARQYSNKNKNLSELETENSGVSEKSVKKSIDVNYSSVFEAESVHEIINSQEEKTKISSISELIDNFTKIGDEISTLSKKSSQSIPENMTPNYTAEGKDFEDQEIQIEDKNFSKIEDLEDLKPLSSTTLDSTQVTTEEIEDYNASKTEVSSRNSESAKIVEESQGVTTEEIEASQTSKTKSEDVVTEASSRNLSSIKESVKIDELPAVTTDEIEDPNALESSKKKSEGSSRNLASAKITTEEIEASYSSKTKSDAVATEASSSNLSSIKESVKIEEPPAVTTEEIEDLNALESSKTKSEVSSRNLESTKPVEKSQTVTTEGIEDSDSPQSLKTKSEVTTQISSRNLSSVQEFAAQAITTEEIEDPHASESSKPKSDVSCRKPKTAEESQTVTTDDIEDLDVSQSSKTKSVVTEGLSRNLSSIKESAKIEEPETVTTEGTENSSSRSLKTEASSRNVTSARESNRIVEEEPQAVTTEELEDEFSKTKSEATHDVSSQIEDLEAHNSVKDLLKNKTSKIEDLETSKVDEDELQFSSEKISSKDLETEVSAKTDKSGTVETKESLREDKEDSKEEVSSAKIVEEISTQIEDISSDSQSLSLEEALESASKIEESLSRLNEKLVSDQNEETEETTPQKKNQNQIDVKKRVFEILADASPTRGDKSPRLQDLYVTAYDVGASNSPEFSESLEGRQLPTDIFGSEAEELWRKQLAIEQEIKQLELQQKEQLPYVFMREIPNKPPPPYTPPSSISSFPPSVIPTEVKQISEIASYSSKVLYKAYQNNTLEKVKFSENGFKLFSKVEVSKICAEFLFNICKNVARDHYKQFEVVEEPSWLILAKKPQLTKSKSPDSCALEKIFNHKLKELFGFKKVQVAESAIIKWGRKKRDHVDEVLVLESQEEESQWTNFDKDELIVKNQVTVDIMKMLLQETADVFVKILSKSSLK
ncbi:centrosome-associated protein 350-like [Tribolium madens]|uniref:centrosome-associated protein 350-like n=1 Tax=Tribolium madens TaxID=41895 RepID=UPI001CF732A0|nr:centrosome-associated protein 350-like [Tribolium madens]